MNLKVDNYEIINQHCYFLGKYIFISSHVILFCFACDVI